MASSRKTKFVVHLMRPVFQRAIVTIAARDHDRAIALALKAAETLPEAEWKGRFDPEKYVAVVEGAETSPEPGEKVWKPRVGYLLLHGNLEDGEGRVVVEPWLRRQSGLMVLDLTRDWIDQLQQVYDGNFDPDPPT